MCSSILCKIQAQNIKFLYKLRSFSYLHNPSPDKFLPLTIGKLLENAANKYGDRLAVISRHQNDKLSFQEALNRADKLAAGLKAIGLRMGDRVGIWAPNMTEWYVTHMACARGGYVLVNMNPAYQPEEIKYCINAVGAKAIVCPHKFKTQNYYEHLTSIAPELTDSRPGKINSVNLPSLKSVIIVGDEDLRGAFKYQELFDLPSAIDIKQIKAQQNSISLDSLCHLQFTSGTTGKPKAPMQTHFQIVNNSFFAGKRNELDRKHHIICVQVPFFHVFGTIVTVNAGLNHGATLVLPSPSFDADKSLDAIRDEKCSVIHGTPTMYVDLVSRQKIRGEYIDPDIAVSGGALCSSHLFKEMKQFLRLKKVKSIYGLTENTAVGFQSLFDDDEYLSTSTVGYLQDHCEAKVVDTQNRIVPRGTPGELLLRGYCIMLGYWENEEKTKEVLGVDRWMRTGDQFVIEKNGYGRVVGRLKDMIIRGGENIFPKDIEDVLNTHPDILETQVVGVPNERLGEEVCACVRIEPNATITLQDVKTFCKGKIAHFKIPSSLKTVQDFPKTTSGKIQKFKILEDILDGKI
ncbi:unnamed protein product [Ceutorhynchus assimilis]|uniref:Medium-chain acyl-CoA ligase ACSF2, mitochondrial n=1 Tax=Ceutorhynchus assimilis TaxID=467358 RepID=A0A9N9QIJ9_9CUCU|nr:unnamed protein product [Ceutorhynchus assimilis]